MSNQDIPNFLAIDEAIAKIQDYVAEHFDGESLY